MRRLTISAKIWFGVGAFIVGAILSTGVNQTQERVARVALKNASEALFPAAQLSQSAESAFQRMVEGFSDAVVVQDAAGLDRAAGDGEQVVAALKGVAAIKGLPAERSAEARELANSVAQILGSARTTYGSVLAGTMTPETQANVRNLATSIQQAKTELGNTKDGLAADLHRQLSSIEESSARRSWMALEFFVATLSVAGIVSWFMVRTIVRPLKKALGLVDQVAQGDLTQNLEVTSEDEVGQMLTALNKMIESMRSALQEVTDSAEGLTVASQELASGCASLASGSRESTARLEQTSASLEEITATVKQNSDNAKQASSLAIAASKNAVHGGSVVQSAVEAMAEIDRSSRKISDIISSIDELAFQTNLLAVNAAIEAARAGNEGRGFAVVAQEVRGLAKRSADAAGEIKSLILDSVRKVEYGSELVDRSGQTLQEIVSSVKRAADVGGEISAACSEEASGIEHVNVAVARMNKITQSSSEQTEKLSSTAHGMSQQAVELKQMLARFVLPPPRTSDGAIPGEVPISHEAVLEPQPV